MHQNTNDETLTGYFGDPKFRKEDETQIDTPIGSACAWCKEAVEAGDTGTVTYGRVMHYECTIRGMAGSIGHQKKLCSCFGGNQEDPEGMTMRQSAVAATHYWHLHGDY